MTLEYRFYYLALITLCHNQELRLKKGDFSIPLHIHVIDIVVI